MLRELKESCALLVITSYLPGEKMYQYVKGDLEVSSTRQTAEDSLVCGGNRFNLPESMVADLSGNLTHI